VNITIAQGPYYPVPPLLNTGAEKVWYGLGRAFAAAGHTVVHFSRRFSGLPDFELDGGVQYVRIQSRDAPRSMKLYHLYDAVYSWRVRRMLPVGADVVITNCLWLPVYLRTASRGQVYVHVARHPKGQMRLYRHASRLQAVSNTVADAIVRELPGARSRVRVIPPYLSNDPRPLTETEFADRSRTVLYVGRIHPEKGVHLLVMAFAGLDQPGWRLELIGSHEAGRGGGGQGYLDQLRRLAGRDVVLLGSVAQEELNAHYRRAAVLVYPSLAERGESFGMVPLEAMACGCAVVVSDLACFRDYLAPEENGLSFDHRASDAVDSLRRALRRLVSDAGLRQRLARAGYDTAQTYRLDRIAPRYLDDFASLTGKSDRVRIP